MSQGVRASWPEEMRSAWEAADSSRRFRYDMNAGLVGFLLLQLSVIWGFFLFTALQIHEWSWVLTVFVVVYVPFSLFVLGTLMRWRAFCVTSAAVVGTKELTWMAGGRVERARLSQQRVDKMGFERIAEGASMEGYLTLKLEGNVMRPIYLYRPYTRIAPLEGFIELLLTGLEPTHGVQGRKKKKSKG